MKDNVPNLYIVGGARCGTTTLSSLIGGAENVFLPIIKEPKTLVYENHRAACNGPGDWDAIKNKPKNLNDYLDLFCKADKRVLLDASTSYLYYHESAIAAIKKMCPEARILIVLRNPIDRAYSQYKLMKKLGREKESFMVAIEKESDRISNGWEYGWHYISAGIYSKSVGSYLGEFNNVCVTTFEKIFERKDKDERKRVEELIGEKLRWDGVYHLNSANYYVPSYLRFLKPAWYRLSTYLDQEKKEAIKKVVMKKNSDGGLSLEDRKIVAAFFEKDVNELCELMGKRVTEWRDFYFE